MQEIERQFKFLQVEGSPLSLYVSESLFMPNQTTAAVAAAVSVNPGETGIELGAGTGPISVILASKPELQHLYTTEIVEEQWKLAQKNIKRYALENKVTAYRGSIFEPIKQNHLDLKVDFIVSDISGMSDIPARNLGWYPPAIPTGGADGTDKIIPLIEQAPQFLKPQGRLYFPIVVNFSDGDKILLAAHRFFNKVKQKSRTPLPLSGELYNKIKELSSSSGVYVPLEPRGSRGIWHLDVYEAINPKMN